MKQYTENINQLSAGQVGGKRIWGQAGGKKIVALYVWAGQ